MTTRQQLQMSVLLCAAAGLFCAGMSTRDGSEGLGAPSIPIAEGSGIVVAGTGLEMQPGTINLNVPADVAQALLYWNGEGREEGDDTIQVSFNGGAAQSITGDLIGGPTFFFWFQEGVFASTYRADVTEMVSIGDNTLEIAGLDFQHPTLEPGNGAGLLVIFDDGTTTDIDLRDGQDLAYALFSPPLDATVPQEYNFAPSPVDRMANLDMFFGSVTHTDDPGTPHPNLIRITVEGGAVIELLNELASNDGLSWDTLSASFNVPAGSTRVTVEAISLIDGSGNSPASLTWITSALSIEPPCTGVIGDFVWLDENQNGCQDADEPGIPGVTVSLYDACVDGMLIATTTTDADGLYRFENLCAGEYLLVFDTPEDLTETTPNADCDGTDEDDSDCVNGEICVTLPTNDTVDLTNDCGLVLPGGDEGCTPGYWKNHTFAWVGYDPDQLVSSVFTIPANFAVLGNAKLIDALRFRGGPQAIGMARVLLRQAVAAILNAAHPDVDYGIPSAQDVIDDVNTALATEDRDKMEELKDELDMLNNAGCPLSGKVGAVGMRG